MAERVGVRRQRKADIQPPGEIVTDATTESHFSRCTSRRFSLLQTPSLSRLLSISARARLSSACRSM